MKKWEYLKVKDSWEEVQRAGAEGWELIYSVEFGGTVYYVFKREI